MGYMGSSYNIPTAILHLLKVGYIICQAGKNKRKFLFRHYAPRMLLLLIVLFAIGACRSVRPAFALLSSVP